MADEANDVGRPANAPRSSDLEPSREPDANAVERRTLEERFAARVPLNVP